MMKRILAMTAATAVLAIFSYAHGSGEHIKGTVSAVGDNSITVQTVDKQSKTVTVDQSTKFQRSGQLASLKDLKVGDRVVIDLHESNGKLHGALVRFGATKKAKAGAAPRS
jgi:hypothetical protein